MKPGEFLVVERKKKTITKRSVKQRKLESVPASCLCEQQTEEKTWYLGTRRGS